MAENNRNRLTDLVQGAKKSKAALKSSQKPAPKKKPEHPALKHKKP